MQKAQLLELVLGTLSRLSGVAPVLFTVEDVHWADRSTLDLTAFLIRSLRNARVLVLVTYRSDELHRRHPLRPLLTSWERDRSIDRIDLRRFDRDEVGAQLHAILGEAAGLAVTETVFDRSGGNAYLVEELAGTVKARWRPGGPAAVTGGRAAQPGGRAQSRRAEAAAHRLGGGPGRAGPAARRGRGTRRERAVRRAARGGGEPPARGRSRRAGLRLPARADQGRRLRGHAAGRAGPAARGVRGSPRARPRPRRRRGRPGGQAGLATALAYHWYAALDLPRALPASIDAARHAMDSYAPAEALRHLERALEIWPRVADATQRTGLDRVEVSRRAGEAAYQSGALDRARSLLADAMAELPADADPVRRALLLERYAIVQRDSGATGEAAESLRKALALLPAGETTRAHAKLLAALANALMRNDDMVGCAEAARNAIAAARACGATGAEADASVTLGVAMAYLGTVDTGLDVLRFGLRLGLETAETEGSYTALRAYVNLSDVLELLSQHAEAAQVAADGLKLAERVGSSRTLGCYLVGNRAEPLLRLGRWAEADRLIAEALADQPEGVFGATLHQLRAELAAMRGGYAEAGSELRAASHTFSHTVDPQFTQPLRYVAALIALHQGDLTRARDAVATGIGDDSEEWTSRYAWPVVWLAMRTEADDATRYRDRREDVPAAITARCAELAGVAARLATTAPALAGYRQLAAAEHARAAGTATAADWAAAVAAWRAAEEPYPLSYALLRLAEAHVTAGETAEAEAAVNEAHALANAARRRAGRRRGRRPRPPRPAEPRLRRRPGKRQRGPAGRGLRAGRRARQVRAHRSRARGAAARRRRAFQPGDRQGAVHQRQDGERARVQHPRQAGRQRPGRGGRRRAPARTARLRAAAGDLRGRVRQPADAGRRPLAASSKHDGKRRKHPLRAPLPGVPVAAGRARGLPDRRLALQPGPGHAGLPAHRIGALGRRRDRRPGHPDGRPRSRSAARSPTGSTGAA